MMEFIGISFSGYRVEWRRVDNRCGGVKEDMSISSIQMIRNWNFVGIQIIQKENVDIKKF